jgi:transposase
VHTNLKTQDQCTVRERNGQLVFALNNEILIPENAPVRLVSAILEELNYEKLYRAYSPHGRKSAADPRVLFEVLVYGYLCGIYSSRKLEEACRYRVDFMWLLEDKRAPDHSTLARFRTGRCREVIEELFYQLVQKLECLGETDHGAVFVDGTKLESRAGRYTFVWRKSVEKHLLKVKEQVQQATGLTGLAEFCAHLDKTAAHISFVHGSGKRKSEAQKAWEKLDELRQRWEAYENSLETMGEGRNSYSKTDPDATFMRLKEDHMRNGQLKPAYNVQIAVNSEYITGVEVFSDRNDVKTLKPFLRKVERFHQARYEEVVADAGYESLENYLYLESTGQMCFIKPANHDQKKSGKFKKQIGRIENMVYDPEDDCFTCAQGRKLTLRRECTEEQNGQFVTTAWYRCEDCSGCPCRGQCCRTKDAEKPKTLVLKKTFWEKQAQAEHNITTPRGIHLRLCRSIQVEGAFGLLKNDFGFRRFLTKGRANIRTELFLLAMAFDLKKLWMKREHGRLQTRVSEKMTA